MKIKQFCLVLFILALILFRYGIDTPLLAESQQPPSRNDDKSNEIATPLLAKSQQPSPRNASHCSALSQPNGCQLPQPQSFGGASSLPPTRSAPKKMKCHEVTKGVFQQIHLRP